MGHGDDLAKCLTAFVRLVGFIRKKTGVWGKREVEVCFRGLVSEAVVGSRIGDSRIRGSWIGDQATKCSTVVGIRGKKCMSWQEQRCKESELEKEEVAREVKARSGLLFFF